MLPSSSSSPPYFHASSKLFSLIRSISLVGIFFKTAASKHGPRRAPYASGLRNGATNPSTRLYLSFYVIKGQFFYRGRATFASKNRGRRRPTEPLEVSQVPREPCIAKDASYASLARRWYFLSPAYATGAVFIVLCLNTGREKTLYMRMSVS